MSRPNNFVVRTSAGIYSLSPKKVKELLTSVSTGLPVVPEGKFLGQLSVDFTVMTQESATATLQALFPPKEELEATVVATVASV